MNKHIELVEKWLEDRESVSLEELKANKEAADAAAYAAYDAAAAYAAYDAVEAAYAAYDAAAAAYLLGVVYVKKYEELTK